jgi:outer membrane murein-binding lipoprotein Lpp
MTEEKNGQVDSEENEKASRDKLAQRITELSQQVDMLAQERDAEREKRLIAEDTFARSDLLMMTICKDYDRLVGEMRKANETVTAFIGQVSHLKNKLDQKTKELEAAQASNLELRLQLPTIDAGELLARRKEKSIIHK